MRTRKPCGCGCGEWFAPNRNRLQFKNRAHYLASPQFVAQVAKGAAAAAIAHAARPRLAQRMTLEGFGVLTPRELAIYYRGRHNGEVFGRRKGYDAGRRKGWQESTGETGDERRWRKGRAA